MPLLSILIATMPERKYLFSKLMDVIFSQLPNPLTVELLFDDSMQYNIGVKRNKLLQRATGDYIVFIDDDDIISNNYLCKILDAIEYKPDCIGISGYMTTNKKDKRIWHISKDFGSWYEKDKVYYRTPNHISPVKRDLALQAGFPEVSYGEDAEYSRRLLPLLKTEVKVSGNIYHYDFKSVK